jgi:hypothetical protein
LLIALAMSRNKSLSLTEGTVCVMRWILRRGNDFVTCQIDALLNSRAYEVSVVPHWNVRAMATESVASPRLALQRHAEIAKQLREAGWVVAARAR